MVVGTCTVDLAIYSSESLKEKRQVIKSLMERIKSRFNVSIAEVDLNEIWKNARLGFACVSNDTVHANKVIRTVVEFIENDFRVEVIGVHIEIL